MTGKNQKILLIINPYAGQMKSRFDMFHIINHLNSRGYITTVHCTSGRGDATNAAITQSYGHDIVVCCGGDGTLNEVISGMIQLPGQIPIGYIPAGSTNDFARTLDLPLKIKKSIKIISEGSPSYWDIGCMNGEKYFSYIASFGAFTKSSYKTSQKLKNVLGHFAYILRGISHLNEIHPYNLKITSENFVVSGSFIFGAVSNTTSIGGMMNFDKKDINLNDGKFEVLLIRTPRNPLELAEIVKGLIKKRYDAHYILFFQTGHIEFEFETPASWTTDGEFGGRYNYVKIDNMHNAVRIIK